MDKVAHLGRDFGSRVFLVGEGATARHHAVAAAALPAAVTIDRAVADPNPAAPVAFDGFPGARRFVAAAAVLAEPDRPHDSVGVAAPPFAHHVLRLCARYTAVDTASAQTVELEQVA